MGDVHSILAPTEFGMPMRDCHARKAHLNRLLAQEITAYWKACASMPIAPAEGLEHDLWHLRHGRDSLRCGIAEEQLAGIDSKWHESLPSWLEHGEAGFSAARPKLIALLKNEAGYLCVHRFKHPTKFYGISEDDLPTLAEANWLIEPLHYWPEDHSESSYGQAALLVAGQMDSDLQNWQPVHTRSWSELRMSWHIDRMSDLVLRGQLDEADGWGNDAFTSAGRAERLLLSTIEQDLEARGRASDTERQELLAISGGYQARMTDLHAQLLSIQTQMATLKDESANAQFEALERHVGFKHGQVIRHRTQGTMGTLVRRHNGSPELALQSHQDMRLWQCPVVTDELRRGEWRIIDEEPLAPPLD